MSYRATLLFLRSFTRRIASDNISFLAGGVAFYGLLALFPALAALVALFGLMADPSVVGEQMEKIQDFFPPQVYTLIYDQLALLTSQARGTLSITALISLLLTISSATRGTKAMLAAMNAVFRLQESRSWFMRQVIAYVMTLGALIILILAMFLIVALPLLLELLPDDLVALIGRPFTYFRWIVLGSALWGGLFLLFTLGPDRRLRDERISTVALGVTVAAALWLGGAYFVSWFVQQMPQLHAAYGSLSAVILLMLWMVMSAYVILMGAAVTATLDYHDTDDDASPKA